MHQMIENPNLGQNSFYLNAVEPSTEYSGLNLSLMTKISELLGLPNPEEVLAIEAGQVEEIPNSMENLPVEQSQELYANGSLLNEDQKVSHELNFVTKTSTYNSPIEETLIHEVNSLNTRQKPLEMKIDQNRSLSHLIDPLNAKSLQTIQNIDIKANNDKKIEPKNRKKLIENKLPHSKQSGSYKCDDCDKSFNQQWSLTRHVLREHKGLRFPCKYCDREFTEKRNLRDHVMQHLGMTYQCDDCDRKFATQPSIAAHTRKVHGKRHKVDKNLMKHALLD